MENTTQAVETEVQTSEPQTGTVVEPTLDDLYKEAGLEVAQPQTQAQPQFQTQPQVQNQKVEVPDPFDIENHKAFLQRLAEEQRATKESQAALLQQIQSEQQRIQAAKQEEDVKQAVDYIVKESGLENSKLAKFELAERINEDPKFRAIVQARDSSPQAKGAFTKALGVIAKEIGKKYEVKTDPQLVANQRALAASRQTSATTQETTQDDKWSSLSGSDFEREWRALVRPNN
jgi:hypothetical protein